MDRARKTVAVVLLAAFAAGACGQKGPLVLPGRAKDTPWPAPAPPPPMPAPAPGNPAAPAPSPGPGS